MKKWSDIRSSVSKCCIGLALFFVWSLQGLAQPTITVDVPLGNVVQCSSNAEPAADVIITIAGMERESGYSGYKLNLMPTIKGKRFRRVFPRSAEETINLLFRDVPVGDYKLALTNKEGETVSAGGFVLERSQPELVSPGVISPGSGFSASVSNIIKARIFDTGTQQFSGTLRLVVVPEYYPIGEVFGRNSRSVAFKECEDFTQDFSGLPEGEYEVRVVQDSYFGAVLLAANSLIVTNRSGEGSASGGDQDVSGPISALGHERQEGSANNHSEADSLANAKSNSHEKINELKTYAQRLDAASTAAEMYQAFDDLLSALLVLKDSAEVAGILNELRFTPKTITMQELEKDFLGEVSSLLVDYLYRRSEANGIDVVVPKPVFDAMVRNAIFIGTGDLGGSVSYLGGQFVDIAVAYQGLQADYTQLFVNQLDYAVLELDAFERNQLSYDLVMSQIRADRDISIGLASSPGGEWSVDTVEKLGTIADLQELKLRVLNGENVQKLLSSMQVQYQDDEFAEEVASLLGVPW